VATLDQLRGVLNGEIGVATDADTSPWTTTVRNNAISAGYAALWRAGVWKPLKQDLTTTTDTFVYALTAIRRLERLELLDSAGRLAEMPKGIVQDDGAGAWELRLIDAVAPAYTLRVRGWTAYKSVFSGGSDTDDLPAEHQRVPLLKAKAILWRAALGTFAKTGEAQGLPPVMHVSVENLLAIISAAEREFAEEASLLSRLRPRSGQTRRL